MHILSIYWYLDYLIIIKKRDKYKRNNTTSPFASLVLVNCNIVRGCKGKALQEIQVIFITANQRTGKGPISNFFFFFNPNLLHLQNIQIIQEGLGTGTVSENILCFLSFFLSFSALPFFYTISCQQVSKWPSGLKPRYRAKSGLKEKGQTNESALRILHLQRGQLAFIRSHLLMHTQWKLWLQGRVQSSTPSTYRERQMQHSYQTGMQIRIHVFLFTVL